MSADVVVGQVWELKPREARGSTDARRVVVSVVPERVSGDVVMIQAVGFRGPVSHHGYLGFVKRFVRVEENS